MNEKHRTTMYLYMVSGLILLIGSLNIALLTYLRHVGVEEWIAILMFPLGIGTILSSISIGARMWKY